MAMRTAMKAIGVDAHASRFLVHFFAATACLQHETAYFHILWRTWTQDNDFLFLFCNFNAVFQNSIAEKFANIDKLNEME